MDWILDHGSLFLHILVLLVVLSLIRYGGKKLQEFSSGGGMDRLEEQIKKAIFKIKKPKLIDKLSSNFSIKDLERRLNMKTALKKAWVVAVIIIAVAIILRLLNSGSPHPMIIGQYKFKLFLWTFLALLIPFITWIMTKDDSSIGIKGESGQVLSASKIIVPQEGISFVTPDDKMIVKIVKNENGGSLEIHNNQGKSIWSAP